MLIQCDASVATAALLATSAMTGAAFAKTYYWISHGSPADPVWTYFLAGAEQWAKDTGNTVNTSFHNGDVAAHQEAVRAAISANADGIVTTSPDPGSLVEVAGEAVEAGIPIINFNTPDPTAPFDAYVGGNNVVFGANWAQYLVDNGLIKEGDFVWMPVEIPGATYGVQEEEGIKSVRHPVHGLVEFEYSSFSIAGRPDLAMMVYLPQDEVLARRAVDAARADGLP